MILLPLLALGWAYVVTVHPWSVSTFVLFCILIDFWDFEARYSRDGWHTGAPMIRWRPR